MRLRLYLPPAQSWHVLPLLGWNLPKEQSLQLMDPTAAYWPAAHGVQLAAFASLLYVPAAHCTHTLPKSVLYWPATHAGVGLRVGCCVGNFVGTAVGTPVGAGVGLWVGA